MKYRRQTKEKWHGQKKHETDTHTQTNFDAQNGVRIFPENMSRPHGMFVAVALIEGVNRKSAAVEIASVHIN